MKNIILALLVAKFAGVRKDGLAQLAGALSLQATTEDEANALVEKFTPDQVNDFVKDFRKDVDKEVSTANKTFETTLKEKFDLVEKKEPNPNPNPNPANPNPTDIAAIIAAEVAKAVNPLQQQLAGFKGQEVSKSRLQTLESKLVNVPETFKAQKLKDFGRMNFETEEAFNEYLTEFETDITAFNQELADKGLSGHGKPFMGGQNKEGISSSVASFITSKTEDTKTLTGKEL
jgi:hypothetical protein